MTGGQIYFRPVFKLHSEYLKYVFIIYKPVNFQRYTGRRPILAVGNSDGDIQMLQFAHNQSRPSLAVPIRHDDTKREYLYDQGSKNVSTEAKKHIRPVISMRHDWSVFPFELLARLSSAPA